jgi:hypothetical protein
MRESENYEDIKVYNMLNSDKCQEKNKLGKESRTG